MSRVNVETHATIKFCVKLGLTLTQTYSKMTAAYVNYKVSRRLISKWHKRFRDGKESLEADSRSGRSDNGKWHNMAEYLMDVCIVKDTVKYHEMKMTLNVFKQL